MSVTGLKKEIQSAAQNRILSQAEVKKISAEVAPTVSNAEAQVLADLYDKTQPHFRPGDGLRPMSAQPPELKTGDRAMSMLDAMIAKNGLPIGKNRETMKTELAAIVAATTLDATTALSEAPRGSKSMLQLPLWDESKGMPSTWDGINQTAYIDAGRQQFYVHTSMTRGNPEAFHGPFPLT